MEILNQKRNQVIAIFALLAVGMIAFTIYRFVDNLKYDSTILVYAIPDNLTVSYDTIKDQKVTTRTKTRRKKWVIHIHIPSQRVCRPPG